MVQNWRLVLLLGICLKVAESSHDRHLRHHHEKKPVKKSTDDDDDDDLDFSKIHFHFHTPSYGNFKMNEPSTVLHELLQQLDKNDYEKIADGVIRAHNLTLASKKKTLDELQLSLDGLKGKGHSYLLDGALADFPNMSPEKARAQFMQMISSVITRAPKLALADSSSSKPQSAAEKLQKRQAAKKDQQKEAAAQDAKDAENAKKHQAAKAEDAMPSADGPKSVRYPHTPKKTLPKDMRAFIKAIAHP
eukprot:gnl/MRDRNA2_/MRDRNA2_60937_c0_seq1.p1 gnl/MRDRNA2_/MRDRNA2_60937_c0~~gnl/MRDRNA2_/MRDRNA2_60937_c0_seq1.p1  ORF type:complete len:247 (+),score=81.21 gnl/MRDRNA2_/MRDRNA2_60937_c0_seq1:61-801(+)